MEVFIHNENVWLTQKRMAELFGIDRSVITKHLLNIFESGELEQNSVCAKIAHTADDGKKYQTLYYSLDAIISVGYRVNSSRATQFRIWATKILKEYLIKGFVMDDERLTLNYRLIGLILALGFVLLLLSVYLPPLQKLLSTQPLNAMEWLIIFSVGLIEISLIELFKKRFFVANIRA